MTVGEIRKAIEGLPDHAFVALRWSYPCDDPEDTLVSLEGIDREEDVLIVSIEINRFGDDEEDDDEDEDEGGE